MLTETTLNNLYFNKDIDTVFLSHKTYDEAEKVFFIFEHYIKEHQINFIKKDLDHYKVTQPTRTIEGIPPLSPLEFVYFVVCSTLIWYHEPSLELSLDYTDEICSRIQSFPALEALETFVSLISFLETNPIIETSDVSK